MRPGFRLIGAHPEPDLCIFVVGSAARNMLAGQGLEKGVMEECWSLVVVAAMNSSYGDTVSE